MKKFLSLLSLSAFLLIPTMATAQGTVSPPAAVGGGFDGPSVDATKVSDALSLWDETPVLLIGNIQKNLGGELYAFSDGTGTITVEIDDEDWMGQTVKAGDKVSIWGEIDKEFNSIKVDVDRIVKK